MRSHHKKVIIIGAGLAGFSLATELIDRGFDIEILERNRYLGGRASDLVDHKMHDAVPIGPHVFASWYNNFFRFLQKIHAERLIEWEKKTFIEMINDGQHYKFLLHRLPAPLFVLPWIGMHPLLSLRDKISNRGLLARVYFSSEKTLEKLDDVSAYEYLVRQKVTSRCIDIFWRFIVLSLLNVPLEKCSAAEFTLLVKRWSRLKRRKFGFPKVGLGDIYADEAEEYIVKRGGRVCRNCAVTEIVVHDGKILHLVAKENGRVVTLKADIVVSTLNPIDLRTVLPIQMQESDFCKILSGFDPVPYISVNLWFDKKISHKKFWAMLNGNGREYLNTDFYDLSNIYEKHAGGSFIASNIINQPECAFESDEEIVEHTLGEIKEVFPQMDAKLIHSHVHRIPYVIYAPSPGSRANKMAVHSPLPNLFLAGDWTINEIPQCMEAAVRSGYKCAEEILKMYGIREHICDNRVY